MAARKYSNVRLICLSSWPSVDALVLRMSVQYMEVSYRHVFDMFIILYNLSIFDEKFVNDFQNYYESSV